MREHTLCNGKYYYSGGNYGSSSLSSTLLWTQYLHGQRTVARRNSASTALVARVVACVV